MNKSYRTRRQLLDELQELTSRMMEAEETLRAIQGGEVDGLIVSTMEGDRVFTLTGAEHPYRVMVETMNEGALTLAHDGTIFFCNQRFADIVERPLEKVIGSLIYQYISSTNLQLFEVFFEQGLKGNSKLELDLQAGGEISVPVLLSASALKQAGMPGAMCMVVADLTEQKRNEEMLAEEKLTTQILHQASELFVLCDHQGQIIRASQSAYRLLGRSPIFQAFDEAFHFFYPDGTPFALLSAMSSKLIQAVEVILKHGDNKFISFLLSANSLVTHKGFIGIVVVMVDITERKSSEEVLHRYDLLAGHSRDIIMFMNHDDGRILEANAAASAAYGYSSEELLKLTIYDLHSSGSRRLVVNEMSNAGTRNIFFETIHRRKDGSLLPVEVSVQGSTISNKRVLISVIRDISGRKQTEEELEEYRDRLEHLVTERTTKLRESEEKYRDLVDSALVGVYQISLKGDILYVNDALLHMLGFESKEEVLSVGLSAILRSRENSRTMINALSGSGKVDHYETKLFTKNGQPLWVVLSAILKGNLISGMVLNISAQKKGEEERAKLEAQLRRTQKMEAIGTLAGGIAHDFNNILAGILGFTEMALEDIGSDNPVYRHLELVLKGAGRGRDLVKQILTFSCLNEQEQEAVVLSNIIDETLRFLRPALPSTISIKKHFSGVHDTIFADPVQMHQIVMNLCANAAHAMKEKGGVLELAIADVDPSDKELQLYNGLKPGVYTRFSVTDTGHGMSPEVLEKIFDPFFTTKGSGEGTGLGLSVVHGIVQSHGGHIAVSSLPGKGSTFNVYLPTIEPVASAEAGSESPIRGGNERILFVDDEETLVELNFQRLSGLGYTVVTKTSSVDALKLFEAEPDRFDLVITDYTMPVMTGIDLARELLAIKPGTPVILVSGLNEKILPQKIEEAGIRAFLPKIAGKREFASLIRQVLDKKTEPQKAPHGAPDRVAN